MTEDRTLQDSLEDFSARALALDPSDAGRVASLRASLETMLKSLEPGSDAAELLKLALTALGAIEQQRHSNTSGLLDAVAAASSAVVQDMDGWSDGLAVKAAMASLAAILASQEAAPRQSPAAAPQSLSPLDSDPELTRDFIAESCDRIAAAEAAILALEANPDDKEQVNTIMRAFHTVKGASGFLGLRNIQDLAHLAESLLIKAREGKVRLTGEYTDAALQSGDALRVMIQGLDPGAKPHQGLDAAKLSALVKRLASLEAGGDQQASGEGETQPALTPACGQDDGRAQPAETGDAQRLRASASDASRTAAEAGVRVNAERLDELVNMVGELVIAHSIIAQTAVVARGADQQLTGSVSRAGKILRSLQDLALGLRMVPLRPTFGKMARLVRDLSRKSGKAVRLVTSGEDTEIDRTMVEVLTDPLVHMIRNAVDHGIESQQERVQRGKNPVGTIHLRAYHSAGNVVIELQDDGRGLCRRRIVASAVEKGLTQANPEMSDAEAYSLIFLPGLSTAEQVTDVSGRGVGMDVVKRNVESLRGKIEVRSNEAEGSTFTLRLPLTLAIADAMLLGVGKERFLLPTISIEHSLRPEPGMVSTVTGRGEMVMVRGQLLPVFRLHRLFRLDGAITEPSRALLVVIEGGGKRCAVMVDELLGQQQVVIKSLGKMFADIPGVSGGAILGDGRVGLILDAAGLVQLPHGGAKAA